MIQLYMGSAMVEAMLAEIFRRIEQAEECEARAEEANSAWFQIYGMRKVIDSGGRIALARNEPLKQERDEYRRIIKLLEPPLNAPQQCWMIAPRQRRITGRAKFCRHSAC